MKKHEQFKQFNRRYWLENGGECDKIPYHEDNGRTQTVFVDAVMFPTWEEWKPQADRAQNAAILERCPRSGLWVRRGDALPLYGAPHFLIEHDFVDWHVWINVLCPDEGEFDRVTRQAGDEIRARQRGDLMALCQATAGTKYRSADLQMTKLGAKYFLDNDRRLDGIRAFCAD